MYKDEFGNECRRHWGGTPKIQTTEAQQRPNESNKAVADAALEVIKRNQQKKGYKSTVLTTDFMSPAQQERMTTLGS